MTKIVFYMKQFINKFANKTEYQAFLESENYVTPNVCLIESPREVIYNEYKYNTNGYSYVDLGLPSGTLWATCNVGATKPEESGLYFAWGDNQGYTKMQIENENIKFSAEDYKWGNVYNLESTRYNNDDGLTTLLPEDDAATMNMGGDWKMPTKDMYEELIANTTNTWTTMNGINGRLFTSKINGNTLFIPAAGSCAMGHVDSEGSIAYVWSSTLTEESLRYSHILSLNSTTVLVYRHDRNFGIPVRGVIGNNE